MATPTAAFSIRLRVRLDNRPGTLGRLATAIGEAGGNITALGGFDVRGATLDEQCIVNCSSEEHIEKVVGVVQALEGVEVIEVKDRTFEMHEGGKIEVLANMPVNDRDDLSMAYTPGVARVCTAIEQQPGAGPRVHDQEEHGRHRHRRHRRARPRRHRPGRRPAGDGGQGAALQELRRRRRLPDLPRRHHGRRDRRDRRAHRPGVRRHQPRGHRRPGLLRDRGPAQGAPRHPRVPRRPARHRGGGARRPRERAADRRQADGGPQRGRRRRRRRRRGLLARSSWRPGVRQIIGVDRKGAIWEGRDDLNVAKLWFAEHTNPERREGTLQRGACPAPTCSSACRART